MGLRRPPLSQPLQSWGRATLEEKAKVAPQTKGNAAELSKHIGTSSTKTFSIRIHINKQTIWMEVDQELSKKVVNCRCLRSCEK